MIIYDFILIKMDKYKKGKIYKIVSGDLVYIGSTTKTLTQRLNKHETDYKSYNRYVSSFKVLKTGNYEILLIENYPCNSRDELRAREQYHIDNTECVNIQRAYRSPEYKKEYTKENNKKNKSLRVTYEKTEKCMNYRKVYKSTNENYKEKFKIYSSTPITCDICNKSMRRDSIYKHRKIHTKPIVKNDTTSSGSELENK